MVLIGYTFIMVFTLCKTFFCTQLQLLKWLQHVTFSNGSLTHFKFLLASSSIYQSKAWLQLVRYIRGHNFAQPMPLHRYPRVTPLQLWFSLNQTWLWAIIYSFNNDCAYRRPSQSNYSFLGHLPYLMLYAFFKLYELSSFHYLI